VPILNISLLIKQMLLGEINWLHFAIVFATIGILSLLALKWAAKILSNEEALLSETKTSPLSNLFSLKGAIKKQTHASASDSLLLYAICIVLLLWVGVIVQQKEIVGGLLITEIMLIALPTYLFAKRLRLNIVETFRLKKIEPFYWLLTIPLAASGFVVVTQIAGLMGKIIAIPSGYAEQFKGILDVFSGLGFWGGLGIIALSPALCEEFLFRGYILDGLTRKWGAKWGIIVSGVLFGAFHLDPVRLIPASILGIIFGAVVWRRGSIFYSMTAHFINNGIAFALVYFGGQQLESLADPNALLPWWLFIASVALFAATFWLIMKENKSDTPGIIEHAE
jgi:sodium transport system permease protein